MIKVIAGKRYDTETAVRVFRHSNGHMPNDFHYRVKALYLTQAGRWFIYHYGGALTDMSGSHGSNRCSGEDIEPVSSEDAFDFLQSNSGNATAVAAIDEYFSEQVEDA